MKKNQTSPAMYPCWYDGKYVNEIEFTRVFLEKHPMRCTKEVLYSLDGIQLDENLIRKQITEMLQEVITSGLAKRSSSILDYIKLAAYAEALPLDLKHIHMKNGIWCIDGTFDPTVTHCNNRLQVEYQADASTPVRWLSFLHDLLDDEDILTLQEYMGYTLIPSTKGQKMLVIIGKGGEGKSRIGQVLLAMIGDAMNISSIKKVETSNFARADLEGKLLMVDDDMDMGALPSTSYIKSMVTAEGRMDLERKRQQSFQGRMYCRFMGFSNGALSALYDQSDGFYRRQLVLQTKERPADREDDPFLTEKVKAELPGILLWCLEGLRRLLNNRYQFTISQRAAENMATLRRENNNVLQFLESEGYIEFKSDSQASSKLIYEAYVLFCEDNAIKPVATRTLLTEITQNATRLGIKPTNNIHLPGGKRVRGFIGIEVIRGAFMPPVK